MAYAFPGGAIVGDTATIANAATTSDTIDLIDTSLVGFVMPSAWTTRSITIQVSEDGTNWSGAYDGYGAQVGSIASPVVNGHYAVDYTVFLPWRYIRFVSSVSQGADRVIDVIKRVLA